MKILKLGILTVLLTFYYSDISAKCDCKGNEVIYVCQNGKTKRVNCSAQTSPNVYCGPCNQKPDCTPGAKCDDRNPCTKWDKYDENCNCYGKFADADYDGVCDAVDTCPGGDDLKDKNKNGMADDCENRSPPTCAECPTDDEGKITMCWIPTHPANFHTVKASCEWLAHFFDEKGQLKGKSVCGPCSCELIGEKDSDGDGKCDSKDGCPYDPYRTKPGPCGCEDCPSPACDDPCQVQGDSEYEWIDKISLNALENQTGNDGGYGDYTNLILELGQGDSLSVWIFPDFLQEPCRLDVKGYIDWNGDCDFDDPGELVVDNQTSAENGADIAVPEDAKAGDLTVRLMIHNGRLKSACQECIDGEVEDYTLRVFSRHVVDKPSSIKDVQTKALQVYPNPIFENDAFVVRLGKKQYKENDLTIFNSSGDLMLKQSLYPGETEFNSRTLPPGLYFFELKNELGTFREKVIITK